MRSGTSMNRCMRDAAHDGAVTAFGKPVNTVYHLEKA